MGRIIGKLTASLALAEELGSIVSAITGLTARTVKNRLKKARGNTLVRNVFAHDWPVDGGRLGGFKVAFARSHGLYAEIAAATGLSESITLMRLNGENGNKLLANAFPELADGADDPDDLDTDHDDGDDDGDDDDDDDDDNDYEGDEDEDEFDEIEDGDETESAAQDDVDLRQRRVISVRTDDEAVRQLVETLGISEATVRRHLRDANGHQLVGNLFARRWRAREPAVARARVTEGVVTGTPTVHSLVAKRYRILSKLGTGGFGTAYMVRDELYSDLGVSVLKFARPPHSLSVERLRKEIGYAVNLIHQNICAYRHIDHDEHFGTFVVLQHGGVSLEKLIENRGIFELEYALAVIRQAATGIDYAHNQGILHQDIKPGNILIQERGRGALDVRISDFGISLRGRDTQAVGGGRTVVATMATGYSPGFASPEQGSGRQVSRKSDQYSLAVVFCSMLEGQVFDSHYSRRTFSRLSAKQNRALERAMRRDPSERFPSCHEFATALGAP